MLYFLNMTRRPEPRGWVAHERIAYGRFVYLWGVGSGSPMGGCRRNQNVLCRIKVSVVRCVMYERLNGSWVWKRKVN